MIHPFSILRWVYLGRIAVATGVFLAAVPTWRQATPEETLLATLILVLSILVTLVSLWFTYLHDRPIGSTFLYLQVIFDALMVTAVVHLTGGAGSDFAPLYIPVIAAGALLLPIPGGFLIGALASILYFGDVVLLLGAVPPVPVLMQMALFVVIALITGLLGDRLRQAGTTLSVVESELRQLRLDTSDILQTIDSGVITVDRGGALAYMNPAAERMLPLRAKNWLDRPVLDELDRRVPGLGEVIRDTLETRQPVQWFETTAENDDIERVIGVRTTTLERGGSAGATALVQDITEDRRLNDLHRRADRLGAVAELSASMAHEIKNPLASIRSAVEQLTGNRLGTADREVLGKLVVTESERLSRLLSQFIEFSRVEVDDTEEVDLGKLCGDAVELARQHPDAAADASIVYRQPESPVSVTGDSDLLHRVVFNLVLNAIQHAGPGGEVSVRADAIGGSDLPPGFDFRTAARLRVSDSGPGIDTARMSRVFDPFFTTRETGSGLGLALVHRAVEAHQGVVFAANRSGGGAEFTVYIPTTNGQEQDGA